MSAYYNEIEPYAAQWLRNLIAAGHIVQGEVDERSILEIKPDDLRGFTQCHFFAGIGVWSHALRSAGWADARPVWTGSCPCQPFSAAGKGDEFADERHLWPAWFRLIRECRPVRVFGEQVASKDALAWIDHVSTDLEGEGYTFGAVDTCAAGFGAPHIRQRLYFVADAMQIGRLPAVPAAGTLGRSTRGNVAKDEGRSVYEGATSELADREGERWSGRSHDANGRRWERASRHSSEASELADAEVVGREGRPIRAHGEPAHGTEETGQPSNAVGNAIEHGSQGCERSGDMELHRGTRQDGSTPTAGFWRDAEWLPCRDGKARPTEPGTFPLAHGAPARVGRLRAYGNAICAPVAQAFIEAFLECKP